MQDFHNLIIERTDLAKIEGRTPFSLVYVPMSLERNEGEMFVLRNFYFLRTGRSVEEAKDKACEEFVKYGLKEGNFHPDHIQGEIFSKNEEISFEFDKNSLKGFNFWIPMGIIGEMHEEERKFPKISSNVLRTNKLYSDVASDLTNTELSKFDLVDLITDPDKPSSIILTPDFISREQSYEAAKGRIPGKISMMNYGYIWDKHTTYFRDPSNERWYALLNKDTTGEKMRQEQRQLGLIVTNLGEITPIMPFSFRECDKIPYARKGLYFDGNLESVFEILRKSAKGIK